MSRVYVGRLSYHAREKDIERFFKGYGRIREINLKNGFGFVEFDDSRDADDAVYDLNGRELLGDKVIIEHARGPARGRDDRYRSFDRGDRRPGWIDNQYGSSSHSGRSSRYGPPVRTDYRVVVENLSTRVSWQDLKDYMRQAGEVTFADAHKQRQNEGIVEFATWSDMHNAIKKLDGTELNGKVIKICEDNQHKKRKRSYSRSRSRSRSRSPRRSRSRSRSARRSPRRSHSRRSRSASRSRSRSHSRGRKSNSKSRSRSKSPRRSQSKSPRRSSSPKKGKSQSRSRSRTASHSKSRSASPKD